MSVDFVIVNTLKNKPSRIFALVCPEGMPRGKTRAKRYNENVRFEDIIEEYLQKTELYVSFVPKHSPIISMQTFSPSHLGCLRLAKGLLL